jgi:hypothetical protein
MTVLMRMADQRPFAYTRDHREYRRLADHSPWAHELNGWLMSARSGRPLAMQVGNFYLDSETLSLLYFESPTNASPPAA